MDFFVDCCQLSVCWRWGTCQVVMSPWRWMYHRFRTAGYNGKATRSVTVLHQAAAGSISGVAPASDKRESWRGREQEREGEWWVSHRKEKLGRERVSRGIEKEPVRVRPRSTSNQGHFLFFSPPSPPCFPPGLSAPSRIRWLQGSWASRCSPCAATWAWQNSGRTTKRPPQTAIWTTSPCSCPPRPRTERALPTSFTVSQLTHHVRPFSSTKLLDEVWVRTGTSRGLPVLGQVSAAAN